MEIRGGTPTRQVLVQMWLDELPAEDLEGLVEVVIVTRQKDLPKGFIYAPAKEMFYNASKMLCMGCYWSERKSILVTPDVKKYVLYHEIGHHVNYRNVVLHWKVSDILKKESNRIGTRNYGSMWIVSGCSGLRSYSFYNTSEFLADSYAVTNCGTSEMKMELEEYWKRIAPESPPLDVLTSRRNHDLQGTR